MKMRVQRENFTDGLPVDLSKLKQYLRVDFDDDDTLIEGLAASAAAQVAHFAQLALLMQTICVHVFRPEMADILDLPIGPAANDAEIAVTVNGTEFSDFVLIGGNRPLILWGDSLGGLAPNHIVITYRAGFGEDASAIPSDIAQAIMDQSALMYDAPSPLDGKALSLSPHMARIAARYRGVSA